MHDGTYARLWNYRNQLTQAGGTASSTYGYDHTGQRVSMKVGANASTTYVNRLYSTTGATTTKHIFANGMLIATIEGTAAATSTHYVHADHLSGSNVVSNSVGDQVQVTDYYPFGAPRIDTKTTAFDEKRKFIGEYYDDTPGLAYLNARYYSGTRGQFLSQDPVFWEVGLTEDGKKVLANPQLQNSYSYAGNNPIINKDPDGRFIPQAVALGALYGGVANVAFQAYSDYQAGNFVGLGAYANSFGQGATIGAAAVYGAIPAAVASIGYSLTSKYFGGGITVDNTVNALAEGTLTGLTGGFLKGLPQVRGVQATKIFGGNYFGGAHGIRYAQEAVFGLGTDIFHQNIQQISQSLLNFYSPKTTTSGSSGGGTINQLSQSVVNYANTPDANLSDPGFVGGIRAINEYNNSLGSQ